MFGLTWAPGRLEALLARPEPSVFLIYLGIDASYATYAAGQQVQTSDSHVRLSSISAEYAPGLRQQCEEMGMNVSEIEAELREVTHTGDLEALQRYMDELRDKYGELIQNAMRNISLDPKQVSDELLRYSKYPESAVIVQDDFGNLFVDNSNELSSYKEEKES